MSIAETTLSSHRDSYRFGSGTQPVLQAGTIGWTVDDLADPVVGRLWDAGKYEIINGVLTVMPAAYFRGGMVVANLLFALREHFAGAAVAAEFSTEVDIAIDRVRVVRADAVVITGDDLLRLASLAGGDWRDQVMTVAPSLVIESTSRGHEEHDRTVKRQWYAELGVPNYWIVDAFARRLECLRLARGTGYEVDVEGQGDQTIAPRAFAGFTMDLAKVWG